MLGARRPAVPAAAAAHADTIHVFTFKEGLLSRLAHDLRLSVLNYDIELRAGRVRARFDVATAHVDGVVVGDHVDSTKFSKQDAEIIERNMRDAILRAERFPSVELEGEVLPAVNGWSLHGRLTMMGRTGALDVPLFRAGSDVMAEVEIKPSLWGIPPFKTMGGAIGIEDRWRVHATLALGDRTPPQLLHPDSVTRWSGSGSRTSFRGA